jgi:hypothetical protein
MGPDVFYDRIIFRLLGKYQRTKCSAQPTVAIETNSAILISLASAAPAVAFQT